MLLTSKNNTEFFKRSASGRFMGIFFIILLFSLFSCTKQNRFSTVDLSNVDVVPVQIERFDLDFFAIDTTDVTPSIVALREKYGTFWDLYIRRVIGNRFFSEEEIIVQFLTDPVVRDFYTDCIAKYTNLSDLEAVFTTAFKYVKYYFPDIIIPDMYAHVSGLQDNILVAEGLMSISLENYLGADYENYQYVFYDYQIPNLRREKIVSDVVFWWLTTEFPDNIEAPKLLENMIYYGKIMYLTEVFLPGEKEENLIGYTSRQLKWCKANEAEMWNYIVENRHLFSTDVLLTAKYINPAPFTSYFPEESPGRTGIWLGWQIIRSYMDKNQDITLPQLMDNFDVQGILEKSGYRP